MSIYNNSIKFCYWNIGGLNTHKLNKIEDNSFIKEIQQYDVVILAETHIGYNSPIVIEHFNYFPVCREISSNGRHYGGLAILRKNYLKNYIKILPTSCKDYQWLRFDKHFFNLQSDLYLCAVYIPPENSSYTQKLNYDILETIEKDVLNFKTKGEILICGDFNARTGSELDFIDNDTTKHLPLFDSYKIDNTINVRNSHDTVVDTRGKELLELCIANQLRIMNGRCIGDIFGRYTCFNPLGQSTVDYLLASENILYQILYFKVSDFIPILSDCHCKISWEILAQYPNLTPPKTDGVLHKAPINYTWSEDSCFKFQNALNTPEIQDKIDTFLNKSSVCHAENIPEIICNFEDILLSAANVALKKPKVKKKKYKSKKWFDADLGKLRARVVSQGILYGRFPKDPIIKGHYYKLYREYNKLRKKKYRDFRQNIVNKLDTLSENNPKQYWDLVNDLKNDRNDKTSYPVDSNVWFNHFKALHSDVDNKFEDRLKNLEILLLEKEKNYNVFNSLDNIITFKEIASAIASLKNGKAKGLDCISNEMLKSGQTKLLPCLSKLFNLCFSNGHYPDSWSKGYISPIFKSNDPCDPNNYRGITITSNLGKLFNSILNTRLDKFLSENNLIHSSQIGFTKHARPSDHCFILKCLIDKYCSTKEGRLYSCFIDFQKAYDSVIHCGLKLKLLQSNIGTKFYNIIKNMYLKSEACVKVGNSLTTSFLLKLGVRQGDNLSPSLFNIFINDLPSYLENCIDSVMLHSKKLNCLMYADDVVIFSTSPEGLQNKLNCIGKFCDDWGMKVNIKKTKVIIFNKAGRLIRHKFFYKNSEIDCVSNYKYLGIFFTASGSFSVARNELYKKALKGYYKLRKDFLSLNPSIKTSMKVFDHTIKPILLYGSEIWGVFNVNNNKFKQSQNQNILINDCYKNLKCETLHIKFCKYILGLHKKSTNHASLSELGRHPLHFNIVKSMLKYCYRLENLTTEFPLLYDAFLCSKELHYKHKNSWYSSVEKLIKILDFKDNVMSLNKSKFGTILNKNLINKYLYDWKRTSELLADGKLTTYLFLKTNFSFENYLTLVKNYDYRKSICKLRTSTHKLLIETGRYNKVPRNERICKNCTLSEIEDETHFLTRCTKFSHDRGVLFNLISSRVNQFSNLSDKDKLFWLLNCENAEILNSVGRFLYENMP